MPQTARHPQDLDLPAWGPYSKRYAGCSHVPAPASGCRLDLAVFPAWHQGAIQVPNVAWDSGYAPWRAAADGSFHSFRHQMLDRDQLTVEVGYAAPGGGLDGRVLGLRIDNRSGRAQNLCLHLVLGCQYPSPLPSGHSTPRVARPALLELPAGGVWVDARDSLVHFPLPDRGRERLVPDGWAWHEQLEDGCVDGGFRWFLAGEGARWRLLPPRLAKPALYLRLRSPGGGLARLEVDGGEVCVERPDWGWFQLPWSGRGEIELRHREGPRCDCDVLVLAAADSPPLLAERRWRPAPAIQEGPESLLLRWPDLPVTYGLRWTGRSFLRQWLSESLDEAMRRGAHNHVHPVIQGAGEGHWLALRLGPFLLPPGQSLERQALICAGEEAEVSRKLAEVRSADLADWYAAAAARAWRAPGEGTAPRAAQLMAATLCTNMVYPVYTRRGYVRHHSPGKAWDSFYTWDSGFIALGLLELDPARAAGCLRQYLMPENDPECAWLQHGSPVPVQIHVARELWNRCRDRGLLARLYPGLRQMHRFLAGRHPGSATRMPSGLLSTWQHFYNSGGWDDYPAQGLTHVRELDDRVAPLITTCQVIACARILRELDALLSGGRDAAEYGEDIESFSAAVRQHAWDATEGWFGYVVHDGAGRPSGLLRDERGVNANRGLDGCYPLLAGICDPEQERRLIDHLADPRELWTPLGLSTVDQSAPYYREDGYWNGAVWLPHCWFFWKGLLDLGAGELAWRLADGILKVWSEEYAEAERCFEKMIISTGRGAGWHHFGGLSSPLLCWHEALHRPGRLSGGQSLWILGEEQAEGEYRAELRLAGKSGRESAVWLCLPAPAVKAEWSGRSLSVVRRGEGLWEMSLPADGQGWLSVRAS